MKKNFFKKLSFVLALAMIVSVLAPAAGVFAAAKPKLSASSKYLHLDVDGKNAYNFNVANKGKGWKYSWKSSNSKVATVNSKNGVVTAKAAGKTTITCLIKDKDGEEKATLKATVTVRDNIKEVTITNKPENGKVAVGVEQNFNRSYVTVANKTTGSESVTRWTVEPADGATINDSGIFVATKPGKYTVTAYSFQSKSKYEIWKDGKDANAGLVLDTDSTEVVVAPTMKSAKQLSVTKAVLTFDTDMSKTLTKDNLKVTRVITANNSTVNAEMLVKEVKFDTTGTEATVEVYLAFVGGENYKFAYEDMNAGFVAAKSDVKDVAKVELGFNTIEQAENGGWSKELTAKLFNVEGVEITTDALLDRVSYEHNNTEVGYLDGKTLTLFNKGDQAQITAIFHTWEYPTDTANGYEEIVVKGQGVVTAVDKKAYDLGSEFEWTIQSGVADGAEPDWNNKNTKISTDDSNSRLFVKVKKTDNKTTLYSYKEDYEDKFTFTSSTPDVLEVISSGNSDYLAPLKEGKAIIVCSYDKVTRATFEVTVVGKREVAQFSLKDAKYSAVVSNSDYIFNPDGTEGDKANFELVIKDQTGKDVTPATGEIEVVGKDTKSQAAESSVVFDGKKFSFNGKGLDKGSYAFDLKYAGKTQTVTIQVNEPTTRVSGVEKVGRDAVTRWDVTLDTYKVDTKVENDKVLKNVYPSLNGYAANGVLCFRADFGTEYTFEVKKGTTGDVKTTSGNVVDIEVNNDAGKSYATVTKAMAYGDGSTVQKIENGTYTVICYEGDVKRATRQFTVEDTTTKASYVLDTQSVKAADVSTVLDVVKKAVTVKLGNEEITDDSLFAVEYLSDGVYVTDDVAATTGKLVVKSVKFAKTFTQDGTTYTVEYTVNLGRTITVY